MAGHPDAIAICTSQNFSASGELNGLSENKPDFPFKIRFSILLTSSRSTLKFQVSGNASLEPGIPAKIALLSRFKVPAYLGYNKCSAF